MSTPQYVDVSLIPLGPIHGFELWIHHIIPIPAPALLARKWTYLLDRFSLWYEDADGDNITLGSFPELISAVKELLYELRPVNFYFKRGSSVGVVLVDDMIREMRNLNMKRRTLGILDGKHIEKSETGSFLQEISHEEYLVKKHAFEEKAREPEYENMDPAIFETQVPVEGLRHLLSDESDDDADGRLDFFDAPEHDDLVATPTSRSPKPHPDHDDDIPNEVPDLIDLPHEPIPIADDPPDSAPMESEFPYPPFPGTFPVFHPSHTDDTPFPGDSSPRPSLNDMQTRISTALQTTLDTLARFGHMTITAAQNTGFPVSSPETFTSARQTLDANTQTARDNLELGLHSARTGLESGIAGARMGLETGFAGARTGLESGLTGARTGLESGLAGARDGVTRASSAVGQATRQVETACRNAAISMQSSGALSNETTDRIIRDLRTAGERMELAVEEMALRLQRRIDAHAQRSTPTQTTGTYDEEDIYGTLPGAFPAERGVVAGERTRIEECTDRLVEMGYFGEEDRDSAGAVSVAAEGDMDKALDIVEGRE